MVYSLQLLAVGSTMNMHGYECLCTVTMVKSSYLGLLAVELLCTVTMVNTFFLSIPVFQYSEPQFLIFFY